MKPTLIISLSLLLLLLLLASCTTNEPISPQERGGAGMGAGALRQNGTMNFSGEGSQELFEQRQQQMLTACQELAEGDSCTVEGRIGEIEGLCEIEEEQLTCVVEQWTK